MGKKKDSVLSMILGSSGALEYIPAEREVLVLALVSQALCWAWVPDSYPPISSFSPPFI